MSTLSCCISKEVFTLETTSIDKFSGVRRERVTISCACKALGKWNSIPGEKCFQSTETGMSELCWWTVDKTWVYK